MHRAPFRRTTERFRHNREYTKNFLDMQMGGRKPDMNSGNQGIDSTQEDVYVYTDDRTSYIGRKTTQTPLLIND